MSGNDMIAAVLHGTEDLRMERLPIPVAGPGELVLRVGAALTCGTDLKVYRRGYHATMLKPPAVFGHEVAGTVVQAGEGVTQFSVGDRVVPLNSAPCGQCFFCGKEQENLCENLLFNNGAYAEYMRIPARIVEKNTFLLPDFLPFEQAALTEPLACVMRGLQESHAQPGDSMVVIGAGPIGLMFMHAASLFGVEVLAVVKRKDQIESARCAGARQVVLVEDTESDEETIKAVRVRTFAGRGADIVIEAVALPKTWQWAIAMVRKGGVVNFFGGPASGTVVALDTNRLHYGDLTLKASFHHTPSSARAAFALISGNRFRSELFLSNRAPLSSVPKVFAGMVSQSASHAVRPIKTIIEPPVTA